MRGVNVTVTNGAQSGMSSLCYAYNEIRQNHAKVMLATGTDENSDVMEKLYRQLGSVAEGKAELYKNTGMAMSDGSTTVVLESAESANSRGAKKYAQVAGYGMTHAVTEYGKVEGTDKGLEDAIAIALKDAGISVSDIDAVYGFGNGEEAVDNIEKNVY